MLSTKKKFWPADFDLAPPKKRPEFRRGLKDFRTASVENPSVSRTLAKKKNTLLLKNCRRENGVYSFRGVQYIVFVVVLQPFWIDRTAQAPTERTAFGDRQPRFPTKYTGSPPYLGIREGWWGELNYN